ncbi:hypothetical protein OHA25_61145 (plasmid) [Nonomuraea sp. NBC_00507]|uniref:helix-turn-helix domain-containing protein n=1 Tax=Nonomuraea sp. NBC_00507 TaxID=2976002 RepID=UPI002E1A00D0
MGNKRKPILDDGPIGQFAQRLRDRMDEVVPALTFRAMKQKAFCSHAVLAEACAGKKLPSWVVTEAFVRACGADDAEVKAWHEDWLQTQRSVGRLRRKLGQADVVVPTHTDTGLPVRDGRLRPVEVDLADPEACVPRPETIQTFDDLLYQLRVLRIAVGNPSLRDLSRHTRVPVSTLGNLFSGRRPSYEVFMQVVTTLVGPDGLGGERQVWREAWTRAEYNRIRPDLTRRRRVGNVFMLSEQQDAGPTAGIVAELPPGVAATLLASLPQHVAAGIISEMPPAKAQAVLTAMWQVHGTVEADSATARNGAQNGASQEQPPGRAIQARAAG